MSPKDEEKAEENDTSPQDPADFDHPNFVVAGDQPIENADFEWPLADELTNVILHGPRQQTIAVTGEWGSGKSSLMRIAQTRIDAQGKKDKKDWIPTVWFNAWRYE